MKHYLVKTPKTIQRLFPKRIWTLPNKSNSVYITFDDGPIPHVTPWVIEQLKRYNANATFFCIGDNVSKYPEIYAQLAKNGHEVGNHTFNHLNGAKTSIKDYIGDTEQAENTIDSKLFRPPYGKIKSSQARALQKKGFKIIMWDILSADFDLETSKEDCLQNVLQNITIGSIIVFHDSIKAEEKLKYALPKVLDYIYKKGWNCASIEC